MRCVSSIHYSAVSIIILSAFLFTLGSSTALNFTSPCPRLFIYENNTEAEDRWYGAITLLSDYELNGVWLRIIFDRPVEHMRTTFGEIIHREGNEYLIKDRDFKLMGSIPYTVRFYIQYQIDEAPANLVGFRLNGKRICPELDPKATTTERLYTSWKTNNHQEVLENEEGSKALGISDKQEVLYLSTAKTNRTSIAPSADLIKLAAVDNTISLNTNKTNSDVSVVNNSTNEVESAPGEEGTLYVSN